jgi:solute carrier family 30 (zinc transporter), member 1
MLNDVLSLCVGLWAVRVANTGSSKVYTYGWQRAETLGALVNGVFLVALCLSIFLEAIQRFVEPQVVSNPMLVLIVGCLGLASNILGLFLFHEHGHSHGHGEAEEGHSHADPISTAEQGHSHQYEDEETRQIQDPSGSIADVLPQVRVAGYKSPRKSADFHKSDEDNTTLGNSTTTPTRRTTVSSPESNRHRRRTSGSFGRGFGSVDQIHIHPASFRNDIIQASKLEERPESEPDEEEEEALLDEDGPNETSRLFSSANGTSSPKKQSNNYGSIAKRGPNPRGFSHESHHHNQPKDAEHAGHSHGGHGHSHGDLNMRGVFLHVMGDALGNLGVIASALIIWLTTFPGRYYFDPGISLVITVIILWSAIPLCKAASRILLQAVPVGMSIDEIRQDIEALERVIEAHHLHVWQLSDTKLVASLHVKVDCEIEGSGSGSYMHLAREIRRCLHGYGIHSSTIQPEFTTTTEEAVAAGVLGEVNEESGNVSPGTQVGNNSKAGSLMDGTGTGRCLLDCEDECGSSKVCCPPGAADGGGGGNGK